MVDPMPTIIDTLRGAAAIHKAEVATPDPRAALVDLFESRAETHDDKSWIEVEEAVDLVLDREAEVIRAAKAEVLREAAQSYERTPGIWPSNEISSYLRTLAAIEAADS